MLLVSSTVTLHAHWWWNGL